MSDILVLGSYPPPYGGVPVHLELLSKYLAKHHLVNVLAGGTSGFKNLGSILVHKPTFTSKLQCLFLSIFVLSKFEIIFLLKFNLRQGLRRATFKRLIRQLILLSYLKTNNHINESKIVLSYNSMEYAPIGFLYARFRNIPAVISIFGEIYMNKFLQFSPEFRHVLSSADALLSCSKHCASSLKLITNNLNVYPIIYGADTETFNSKEKLDQRKYDLLFVGRLSAVMGLDDFLRIVTHLPSTRKYKVAVAGAKGDLFPQVLSFIPPEHVELDVISDLSTKSLARLYRDSSIYLMLSKELRSCSSLSSIEAMMSSCYVMARGIGGVPELFPATSRLGELLPPEINIVQIANKITYILNNLLDYQKTAFRANEYAIHNYDAKLPLKYTSDLIDKLLSL